jgi:ABC-type lipoprotein release transport system permease subunit
VNNLILGAIAGIGGLCLIVVMSYESGFHDGKVETQLEAGKQMAKNQVINKNNDIDSNNIASVVMGANKLLYNNLINNTETIVQLVPINSKCDFKSSIVNNINKRGK